MTIQQTTREVRAIEKLAALLPSGATECKKINALCRSLGENTLIDIHRGLKSLLKLFWPLN
jgi:hypothetical protein